MASKTASGVQNRLANGVWVSAVIAGLAAGIAMGVLESIQGVMPTIGTLYGVPTFTAGWVAHLFHSVMLALVFGIGVSRAPLRDYAQRLSTGTALGVGYGVVLTVVTGGIVLPLWLMAIGVPNAPSVPNLTLIGLVNHLVYGVVLGAVYPLLRNRW
jgi:uncharacterized membrane protein YagU involved in acid resistance